MDAIFGQLAFLVYVQTGDKGKKMRLHSVWCEHKDCEAQLAAFRESNRFIQSREIFAEFVFTDTLQ